MAQRYNNSFYISSLYPLISDDKLDIRLSGDPDRYLCFIRLLNTDREVQISAGDNY